MDSAGLVARLAAAIPSSVSARTGAVYKAARINVRRVRVAKSPRLMSWLTAEYADRVGGAIPLEGGG